MGSVSERARHGILLPFRYGRRSAPLGAQRPVWKSKRKAPATTARGLGEARLSYFVLIVSMGPRHTSGLAAVTWRARPSSRLTARRALRLAPAAEDEAAEGEAEAERADGEAADRDCLPRRRESLPPPERLLFLRGQLLTTPLLAQRTAGAQPEIEVVEDLAGVVGHRVH